MTAAPTVFPTATEVGQRGAHALNSSVTECNGYSEMKLSSNGVHSTFTAETSGLLFIEMSLTEECKAGHTDREHPTSEASALIVLMTESTKN